MDEEKIQNTYGKLVAKAWADADFKEKLLTDTRTVFRNHGIQIPDDIEVSIVENSERKRHFILPCGPLNFTVREHLGSHSGHLEPAERCQNMYDYD